MSELIPREAAERYASSTLGQTESEQRYAETVVALYERIAALEAERDELAVDVVCKLVPTFMGHGHYKDWRKNAPLLEEYIRNLEAQVRERDEVIKEFENCLDELPRGVQLTDAVRTARNALAKAGALRKEG